MAHVCSTQLYRYDQNDVSTVTIYTLTRQFLLLYIWHIALFLCTSIFSLYGLHTYCASNVTTTITAWPYAQNPPPKNCMYGLSFSWGMHHNILQPVTGVSFGDIATKAALSLVDSCLLRSIRSTTASYCVVFVTRLASVMWHWTGTLVHDRSTTVCVCVCVCPAYHDNDTVSVREHRVRRAAVLGLCCLYYIQQTLSRWPPNIILTVTCTPTILNCTVGVGHVTPAHSALECLTASTTCGDGCAVTGHSLNGAKTEFIWCTPPRRRHHVPSGDVQLGPDLVQPVQSARDLGVFVDGSMMTSSHINNNVVMILTLIDSLIDWRRRGGGGREGAGHSQVTRFWRNKRLSYRRGTSRERHIMLYTGD